MRFQKLTYSGAKCNNYIYFAFDAEIFNVDEISKGLNIKPTSVMIKKDPVPKSTSWIYKVEAGDEIDLKTSLEQLIDLLEPKITEIKKLKDNLNLDTRLQFVIDVDIDPNSSTPYFPLNKKVINFLYRTGTEVDFDLYKTDTIGILENK